MGMSLEHSPGREHIRLRNTRQSASYLHERYGISRSVATLDKLRCVGGGPEFRKIGSRHIGYEETALDTWAQSLISKPLTSTSSPRQAA
jgi:predicted DNA-binding transcriptional regulator AlpA